MDGRNILVLTYWSLKDPLIQTYTLPYIRIIQEYLPADSRIFLVTLEQERFRLAGKESKTERVSLKKEGIEWVPKAYKPFGARMAFLWLSYFWRLLRLIRKERIRTIHAWCTPAGAAGYLLSRLTGCELVLDSFEPHAEAMVENGTWRRAGISFKILFFLEKKQIKRAKAVIGLVKSMKEYIANRYRTLPESFYVKPACVHSGQFEPKKETVRQLRRELKLDNQVVCVYAGKFDGIYYGEEILHFMKIAAEYWEGNFRAIVLTSAKKDDILSTARRIGLDEEILDVFFVPHEKIATYLALGDFAINPVKPVPSKRYCTSIKDGEYWAMGLPVVITPGISDDSDIIERENIGAVVRDFRDETAVREALEKIDTLLRGNREALRQKIRSVAERYRNFEIARNVYREIYG